MANHAICKKCKLYRPKDSGLWASLLKPRWYCRVDGHQDLMGPEAIPVNGCLHETERAVSSKCEIESHNLLG